MAPSENTPAHTVVAHAKKEQQAGAVPEPLSRSQAYAQFNCCVLDFLVLVMFFGVWGFFLVHVLLLSSMSGFRRSICPLRTIWMAFVLACLLSAWNEFCM